MVLNLSAALPQLSAGSFSERIQHSAQTGLIIVCVKVIGVWSKDAISAGELIGKDRPSGERVFENLAGKVISIAGHPRSWIYQHVATCAEINAALGIKRTVK